MPLSVADKGALRGALPLPAPDEILLSDQIAVDVLAAECGRDREAPAGSIGPAPRN